MTFRDLLRQSNHREIFNYLHKEYYYKDIDDEVHQMAVQYQKVMDALLALPLSPNKKWEIEVRAEEGKFDDICWVNLETQEVYALDLTPWSELVDASLREPLPLEDSTEAAAHILYEITFYGFTEEAVVEEGDRLRDTMERLESGEEKLVELTSPWEDVDSRTEEEA